MNQEKIKLAFMNSLNGIESEIYTVDNMIYGSRLMGALDTIEVFANKMKECSLMEIECFNEITRRKRDAESEIEVYE